MDSDLLTTGQTAKLCGVTPDAVLKWVRKGDLPASRTAGGHCRISRETLRKLDLCQDRTPAPTSERCWEYFGRRDAPVGACKDCVVYRARAERCFEVARIKASIGHQKRFCASDCQTCSFYQMQTGLKGTVLVVTAADALIAKLAKKHALPNAVVRTAKSANESAAVIETFHPRLVVLDGALPDIRKGRLLASILNDDRLSSAKIAVCTAHAAFARRHRLRLSTIPPPLSVRKIKRLAKALFGSNASAP